MSSWKTTSCPSDQNTLLKLADNVERIERKLDEALLAVDSLRRRLTTYVGEGVALTYLFDDTPIYVNSYDFGPPANYINGGVYERENLDVIMHFVRDDTVFLDVGANLGFFSLLVARRVRSGGKVHAFEPNPRIARLLCASAYLNGFSNYQGDDGVITIHNYGLGRENTNGDFCAPVDHAGGGARIQTRSGQEGPHFSAPIKRLDNVFDESFNCDLVKIDVEGQEADVLHGMLSIIRRSPNIKIIFETLTYESTQDEEIEQIMSDCGLLIYAITPDGALNLLAKGELTKYSGYALAARATSINCWDDSAVFRIYPMQLNTIPQATAYLDNHRLSSSGGPGQLLFHGPYWSLRSGVYEIALSGKIVGDVRFSVATRFGHEVAFKVINGDNPTFTLVIDRDLIAFECIARSVMNASIDIHFIDFNRIG